MLGFFSTLVVLIAVSSISVVITGTIELNPELGPAFVDPYQRNGPVYVKYDPSVPYNEFLYKTFLNTKFWYVDGIWSHYPPYSLQLGNRIEGNVYTSLVDIYTGNYMYPFLKDCELPIKKTYLGHFNSTINPPLVRDLLVSKKYFAAGTLDIYNVLCNKTIFLPSSDMSDNLSAPFFEWYNSWSNLDQFKIFHHFYFPLDRNIPSWVNLFQITKSSIPHSSILLDRADWVDLGDSLTFSTIDFVENADRLSLCSVDPIIWFNTYTQEQAMFRYYEPTTGIIALWTPADLVLNYEIGRVSRRLSPTSTPNTLYFNFIETESFDWINDPWHDIGYAC